MTRWYFRVSPDQLVYETGERITGRSEVQLADESFAATHCVDTKELEGNFAPVNALI